MDCASEMDVRVALCWSEAVILWLKWQNGFVLEVCGFVIEVGMRICVKRCVVVCLKWDCGCVAEVG